MHQDDPDWQATCIRIIEFFSAAWGGAYNIIVPTDGNTIPQPFWEILGIYDPDYLFFYYHTGKDFKLNRPDEYRQRLERELEHFVSSGPVSDIDSARRQIDEALMRSQRVGEPSAELQSQLIKKLAPFHIAEHAFERGIGAGSVPDYPLAPLTKVLTNIEHTEGLATYEPKYAGVYRLWLASVTGLATDNLKGDLNSLGVPQETIPANDYGSVDLFIYPTDAARSRKQRNVVTPFELANIDTGLYQPVRAMSRQGPSVLVAGETIADFCLYYALSKLRHSVIWLPVDFLKSQQETGGQRVLLDAYADLLKDVTSISQIERDPKYAIVSASTDKAGFDSAIEALNVAGYGRFERIGDSISVAPDLSTLLQHPLRLYEKDNVYRPSALTVSENSELDFFETPKPKNFTRLDPYENRWITEINVPSHQLPRNHHLGQWIVRHPTLSSNGARIAKSGIAYFCPNAMYFGGDIDTSLVRPTVFIPDAFQVFEHLFEREGYRASPSDKGFFARDTIQKLGNLSALASFIRTAGSREMLMKFLDHIKPAQGVHDEGAVLNDRRRYLNFPSMAKLLRTDSATQKTIEALVTAQVLHRGFVFKCRFCRSADWFSLDEVSQNFKCKRCGRSQGISAENYWYGTNEPGWFYKLDEIVYQFLRHNGHVTLLALDHLRAKAEESFLYTPDLELAKQGAADVERELDILCIRDGATTIGEAKKDDRLGNSKREEIETIQKYNRLAERIGAEALVFATFAETWSENTQKYINGNATHCDVILLTRADLLDEHA